MKVMILLSVLYGVVLALLGYLGNDNIELIAVVGALALGVGWVARALFLRK